MTRKGFVIGNFSRRDGLGKASNAHSATGQKKRATPAKGPPFLWLAKRTGAGVAPRSPIT